MSGWEALLLPIFGLGGLFLGISIGRTHGYIERVLEEMENTVNEMRKENERAKNDA